MVLYLSRTFLEFFPFKFQYVIYDCKDSRFKKRNLCGIRTNYIIIGDIYHSYTHVNTGPTVKSSVLIRIHPKCNVHHNQRNHDVVVIILLVYQSSSSVLHVIDEFMVPSTGLQRHEWSHKFMQISIIIVKCQLCCTILLLR